MIEDMRLDSISLVTRAQQLPEFRDEYPIGTRIAIGDAVPMPPHKDAGDCFCDPYKRNGELVHSLDAADIAECAHDAPLNITHEDYVKNQGTCGQCGERMINDVKRGGWQTMKEHNEKVFAEELGRNVDHVAEAFDVPREIIDGSEPEMVNHPQHYGGDTTYETIKVIEAWGLDKNFCLGNTIKYVSRCGKKNDTLEDLKKALWYLQREVDKLEKENKA